MGSPWQEFQSIFVTCSPTPSCGQAPLLLRETLLHIAKADLGWDIEAKALASPTRAIVDIFQSEIADFSKYKLAKA
jgi:hypothetical protein